MLDGTGDIARRPHKSAGFQGSNAIAREEEQLFMGYGLRVFDGQGGGAARLKLSEYFRLHFLPERLGDPRSPVAPSTIKGYEEAIAHWVNFTADPPLDALGEAEFRAFLSGLKASPGRKGNTLSSYTVRKHQVAIDAVLRHAAKAGECEAELVIGSVPVDRRAPAGDFSTADIRRLWHYARDAERPHAEGKYTACLWWRALVLTAAYTGFRRGTLMRLEWSDLQDGWFIVRPEIIKRRKGQKQLVHPQALEALEKIRSARRYVFDWPNYHTKKNGPRWFTSNFAKLTARLDEGHRHGITGFRKWHATEMGRINPLAAMISLNHGTKLVITAHYTNHILAAEAIEQLPLIAPEKENDDDRQQLLF